MVDCSTKLSSSQGFMPSILGVTKTNYNHAMGISNARHRSRATSIFGQQKPLAPCIIGDQQVLGTNSPIFAVQDAVREWSRPLPTFRIRKSP